MEIFCPRKEKKNKYVSRYIHIYIQKKKANQWLAKPDEMPVLPVDNLSGKQADQCRSAGSSFFLQSGGLCSVSYSLVRSRLRKYAYVSSLAGPLHGMSHYLRIHKSAAQTKCDSVTSRRLTPYNPVQDSVRYDTTPKRTLIGVS
jgi:hypothetical protein